MRPLRYFINITPDGCCDHMAITPTEEVHRHAAGMLEAGWRFPPAPGTRPEWMEPFAATIGAARKYVVSSTLDKVEWNSELIRGDLETAVRELKEQPGKGICTGGVTLPRALAELGLIDEYEFLVHPRLAGHGPTVFGGLAQHVDLRLVQCRELESGSVALTYLPKRVALTYLPKR